MEHNNIRDVEVVHFIDILDDGDLFPGDQDLDPDVRDAEVLHRMEMEWGRRIPRPRRIRERIDFFNVYDETDVYKRFRVRKETAHHIENLITPAIQHGRIFRNSRVQNYLREQRLGLLLGDNGYACERFLLTPVLRPLNEAERLYNASHKRTRNLIEHVFGLLKKNSHVSVMIQDYDVSCKHVKLS